MAKPFNMKKTLLSAVLLLLLFCAKINAQTVIPTWYIIPPTSGCNGVWAVQASAAGCGGNVTTYNMNPPGCVIMGGPTVVDTTYWSLCAFPCTVTMVNSVGQMCICSTGTMTGYPEISATRIVTTYPNPCTTVSGWNVWLQQPGENVTVNIYNSLGQLVLTQTNSAAEQIVHVDTSTLAAGTYSAEITVNGATPYNQQLIITQ